MYPGTLRFKTVLLERCGRYQALARIDTVRVGGSLAAVCSESEDNLVLSNQAFAVAVGKGAGL